MLLKSMFLALLMSLVIFLLPLPVGAATWNGTTTDWGTATNWSGTDVPDTTTEDADIDETGSDPTIGAGNYSIQDLNFTSAANLTLGGTGILTLAGGDLTSTGNVITIAPNLTLSADTNFNISGGSLAMSGDVTSSSTITLSGTMTATGDMSAATGNFLLGDTSGNVGIYSISGGTSTPGGDLYFNKDGSAGGISYLTNNVSNNTFSNNITLMNPVVSNESGYAEIGSTLGDFNISGNITTSSSRGSGAFQGVRVRTSSGGTDSVTFSGTNDFTGIGQFRLYFQGSGIKTFYINSDNALNNAGNLRIQAVNASTTARIMTKSAVTVSNAIFDYALVSGAANTKQLVVGGEHTSGTATFSGNITLNFAGTAGETIQLETTNAGAITNFTGVIGTVAFNIEKTGAGEVILSHVNNSYSGTTSVLNGTLTAAVNAGVSVADAFGNSATAVLVGDISGSNSATLNINTSGVTVSRDVTVQSGSSGTKTVQSSMTSGTATYSGTVTLSDATTFAAASGGTTNVSGQITSSGAVTIGGAGTVQLSSSSNDFTGAVVVDGGILKIGHANALGTTAGATTINAGAVLDINGQTVGAESVILNGTGISSIGVLINSSATAASLSGAVTLGSNSSIGGSGDTTLSGVISGGSYTLEKVGAGELTLSGANSYTGATILNAGTLTLSGSVAGELDINAGIFQTDAAASASTLSMVAGSFSANTRTSEGSLSFTGAGGSNWTGGTYVWSVSGGMAQHASNIAYGTVKEATGVAGSDWDYMSFTGSLDFAGASANSITIEIDSNGTYTGYEWEKQTAVKILTSTGGILNYDESFFNLGTSGFDDATGAWWVDWSLYNDGNSLWLTYNATPEPSTYAMGGLLSLLIIVRYRFWLRTHIARLLLSR